MRSAIFGSPQAEKICFGHVDVVLFKDGNGSASKILSPAGDLVLVHELGQWGSRIFLQNGGEDTHVSRVASVVSVREFSGLNAKSAGGMTIVEFQAKGFDFSGKVKEVAVMR